MSPSPCSFMTALDESFALTVSLPIIFCLTSTYLPFSQVGNLFLTQSPTLRSSILTRSPPCRTFQSDEDSSPSPHALLLVWTSELHQRLLKIVYHLFPHQTCAPQTLWTSQATSDSREALEFNLHGSHR